LLTPHEKGGDGLYIVNISGVPMKIREKNGIFFMNIMKLQCSLPPRNDSQLPAWTLHEAPGENEVLSLSGH
jgi:hypothetical protein